MCVVLVDVVFSREAHITARVYRWRTQSDSVVCSSYKYRHRYRYRYRGLGTGGTSTRIRHTRYRYR